MLEVKNLVKIYRPKHGVPVKALDDISLKFPDKGLVFLLGKSGSGKSTLLNVLGGLDRHNSGQILINGKSTKTFRQSHYDSYRNTYVGFIFQEYNILEDFSVGVNIALALQLQGQKPTSERINEILKEVDLEGYGNRKPNELSGGQKQRVAIARALVKNPRIIMADEPTGALDSVTGKQILTTLKKLSRDKLVIVVSHDQEFAQQYADRIITLSDGRIIDDVQRMEAEEVAADELVFTEEGISAPEGYILTQEDMAAIQNYIQKVLSRGGSARIESGKGSAGGFQKTDTAAITHAESGYKLIRSRLPMKYAFKLGASGLKYKKFRLVMTILLSCVAFVFFGVADTLASYNYVDTCTNSLAEPESTINYVNLKVQTAVKEEQDDQLSSMLESLGLGSGLYWSDFAFSPEDIEKLEDATDLDFYPVYTSISADNVYFSVNTDLYEYYPSDDSMYEYMGYFSDNMRLDRFSGYVEVSRDLLEDFGAEVIAGELPTQEDQLAVSEYALYSFQKKGYRDPRTETTTEIHTAEDLLGKTLYLDHCLYTITAVVDTGMDIARYEAMEDMSWEEDFLRLGILSSELQSVSNYSLSGFAMVAPGQISKIAMLKYRTEYYYEEPYTDDDGYYHRGNYYDEKGNYCLGATEDFLGRLITIGHYDAQGNYYPNGYVDSNGGYYLADGSIEYMPEGYYDTNGNFRSDGYFVKDGDGYLIYDRYGDGYWTVKEKYDPNNDEYYMGDFYFDGMGAIIDKLPGGIGGMVEGLIPTDSNSLIISEEPVYGQCIAGMPDSAAGIRKVVELTNREYDQGGNHFLSLELQNPVNTELNMLGGVFTILSKVFVVIGVVFVIFASLLFSNFIAVSISNKKQEIGILRAIGSRSNDVFRIFFSESFIIAMINFAISFAGTVGVCLLINTIFKANTGLLITILNVGIRQFAVLFVLCLALALVASFLPVYKIASKRPIDAIRNR